VLQFFAGYHVSVNKERILLIAVKLLIVCLQCFIN